MRIHFWLMVVGFNLTFFVQHFLGLLGMPRRVFTYPDLPYWGTLNLLSTLGAVLMGVAVLAFVANIVHSLRRGATAGDNPWDAWTLEWATTSPPPHDNFELVPPVRGRRPLYDLKHPATGASPGSTSSPAARVRVRTERVCARSWRRRGVDVHRVGVRLLRDPDHCLYLLQLDADRC